LSRADVEAIKADHQHIEGRGRCQALRIVDFVFQSAS
jgi:hypothetical protein